MSPTHNSVVLIGMPGAGKSTTGILLAKNLGLDFIDTDITIQTKEGKTLQTIIEQSGYLALRDIEEQVVLATHCENSVVATGGSVVYSKLGMEYLKEHATIVYLETSLDALRSRIHNYENRGIAMAPNQTFESLFSERTALYNHYADICINNTNQSAHQAVTAIERALRNLHN